MRGRYFGCGTRRILARFIISLKGLCCIKAAGFKGMLLKWRSSCAGSGVARNLVAPQSVPLVEDLRFSCAISD